MSKTLEFLEKAFKLKHEARLKDYGFDKDEESYQKAMKQLQGAK